MPQSNTPKRFYIVKSDDHAVVRSVPVSVCAATPRVDLVADEQAPTCPVEETAIGSNGHGSANGERGRTHGSLRNAVRLPNLAHRPHLPHIGRPGR